MMKFPFWRVDNKLNISRSISTWFFSHTITNVKLG
jgi:hypothetical protein